MTEILLYVLSLPLAAGPAPARSLPVTYNIDQVKELDPPGWGPVVAEGARISRAALKGMHGCASPLAGVDPPIRQILAAGMQPRQFMLIRRSCRPSQHAVHELRAIAFSAPLRRVVILVPAMLLH